MKRFVLAALVTFAGAINARQIVIPFSFQNHGNVYEAFAFLPEFMRNEYGSMDHVDLLLSSLTPEVIAHNYTESRGMVVDFHTWLADLYDRKGLVDAQKEKAMVARMLEGNEKNSSLILLLKNGKFIGSLRVSASTNQALIPEDITNLKQPRLNRILTPNDPQFTSQVVPLVRPSSEAPGENEIVWDPRHFWLGGGISYLANFSVQPESSDDEVLWMLYTLAIATKIWERGGQTMPSAVAWPTSYSAFLETVQKYLSTFEGLGLQHGGAESPLAFHWPNGVPEKLTRSRIGVLNDRFVLTCDGETKKYIRHYEQFGFKEIYRFNDKARNGKITVVMLATKDDFVNAFEQRSHAGRAFRLDYIPNWKSRNQIFVPCGGQIIQEVDLQDSVKLAPQRTRSRRQASSRPN